MAVPPLQLRPISTSHYYTSGDVRIQAGVAIAPGVLIQADPDCYVLIKSGACIGIGTILHAHDGVVEVGEGASIGAEVLLIGQVTIGAHACIGSASTILNSSIELRQIVPPGSLIGDPSHPSDGVAVAANPELHATDTTVYPAVVEENGTGSAELQTLSQTGQVTSAPAAHGSGVNVYGQMYVNKLLVKLFPRASLDEPTQKVDGAIADPWNE